MNLRPTQKPGGGAAAPEDRRPVRAHADILAGGGREHIDVTVPRTEIRGRMRLISRAEMSAAKADARREMQANNLPTDPAALAAAGLVEEWNLEIATRIVAVAVRSPVDEGLPLATLEEWRDCDDDQIDELFVRYQDLRDRIDPMSEGARLTAAEREEIERLAKKGEASLLMHFGSRRLALYAISTVAPPAS